MDHLFTISFLYEDRTHRATVLEYQHSPSIFYVTFLSPKVNIEIPKVIIQIENGSVQLSKDSPNIDKELLLAITDQIKQVAEPAEGQKPLLFPNYYTR